MAKGFTYEKDKQRLDLILDEAKEEYKSSEALNDNADDTIKTENTEIVADDEKDQQNNAIVPTAVSYSFLPEEQISAGLNKVVTPKIKQEIRSRRRTLLIKPSLDEKLQEQADRM